MYPFPPTPERLARGHYLAEYVSLCTDCHSERDWTFFSGPLKEDTRGKGGELFGHAMGLPGEIYSPNLTPAALGDWTDGEILRAVTTGVSRDGRALFPVMPYPHFGRMVRASPAPGRHGAQRQHHAGPAHRHRRLEPGPVHLPLQGLDS